MTAIQFKYHDETMAYRKDVLAVDGVFGAGPNLSHWPGNRTPSRYRHEVSTGMALALARDPERALFLRGVTTVSNNHYDTDGVLSVFAVMKPEAALPHADLLLAAARAGDFEETDTVTALAFDEIVLRLGTDAASPLIEAISGISDDARHALCYRWLLDRLPDLAVDPAPLRHLWQPAATQFEEDMATLRDGSAEVTLHKPSGIAVVKSPRPLCSRAVITRCRGWNRILMLTEQRAGWLARFVHTTRSWFDLPAPVPERFNLTPVARALAERESDGEGVWHATETTMPLCELTYGVEERPPWSAIESSVRLVASRLAPDVIFRALEASALGRNPAKI